MLPFVTAIVPNYNHARFLHRRLESIYKQTWPNLKVILLDDASTDDSLSILEAYRSHPRTQCLLVNDTNAGSPIRQWYKGIEQAQTDWVWIAESDDTCDQRFLESLAPALMVSDCILALSEICFINEQDETIMEFSSIGRKWWDARQFRETFMLTNCHICNSGMALFRKSAIPPVGSWLDEYPYSPDYTFWMKLLSGGRVYTNGEALACFRKHDREFTHGTYDSLAEHRDHARMMAELWQTGDIPTNLVKKLLYHKLTNIEIRKTTLDAPTYRAFRDTWLSLAEKAGLRIGHWEIRHRAFSRKIRHRFGI